MKSAYQINVPNLKAHEKKSFRAHLHACFCLYPVESTEIQLLSYHIPALQKFLLHAELHQGPALVLSHHVLSHQANQQHNLLHLSHLAMCYHDPAQQKDLWHDQGHDHPEAQLASFGVFEEKQSSTDQSLSTCLPPPIWTAH